MYLLTPPPPLDRKHALRILCSSLLTVAASKALAMIYTYRTLYTLSAMLLLDLHTFWTLVIVPLISVPLMIHLFVGCNNDIFQPHMTQYLWKTAYKIVTTTRYAHVSQTLVSNCNTGLLGDAGVEFNERASLLYIKLLGRTTVWNSVDGLASNIRTRLAFLNDIGDEDIRTELEWLLSTGEINNESKCLKTPAFQMLVMQQVLQEQNTTGQSQEDQSERIAALLKELKLPWKLLVIDTAKLVATSVEKSEAVKDATWLNAELMPADKSKRNLESIVIALQSRIGELMEEKTSIKQNLESQLGAASQITAELEARLKSLQFDMEEGERERAMLESEIEKLSKKSQTLLSQLTSTTKSQAQLRRDLATHANVLPDFQRYFEDVRQAHATVINSVLAALEPAQGELTRLRELQELSVRVEATTINPLLDPEKAATGSEQEVSGMLGKTTVGPTKMPALETEGTTRVKHKVVDVVQDLCQSRAADKYQLHLLEPWRTRVQPLQQVDITMQHALTGKSRTPQFQGSNHISSDDIKRGVISVHNERTSPPQAGRLVSKGASWLAGLGEPPALARRIATDGQHSKNTPGSVARSEILIENSTSPAHVWRFATGLPASRAGTPAPGQGECEETQQELAFPPPL
ncbi:hypothetical protein K431DRAFT_350070 [Polychaeton citri CBS 116435]|uniref:Uncharacterized protein n=1 Tax=Polychaeton citri CBS 116435 TaxID=1314669 RepID=A0A9P4PXI8_9PEZI|nr:hypothetical protein K431DRAFT_350070 [Polychaeton citri CBS 116435]